MASKIIMEPSLSLREFRLLTGLTTQEKVASKVSLKTRLCSIPGKKRDFIELNLPFMSAAMQAVTGRRLSIALAQHGGIGVLPCSIPADEQAQKIRDIKRFKAGFHDDVICVKMDTLLKEVAAIVEEKGYNTFPVTDTGRMGGRFLGVIRDKEFDPKSDSGKNVRNFVSKHYVTARAGITLDEANKKMVKHGSSHLYVLDTSNRLRYVVFKKDLLRHIEFPEGSVDSKRRYLVGAAVSTHPKDRERVDAVIDAGADVIFIDSSDGFSVFQKEMLGYIRSRSRNIPVIGGNVITREGFRHLADAGFNGVKIGMGIGSGCITQEQKGTGRGQATALIEIARERDSLMKAKGAYIPIISDGGIANSSHMVISLALGADSVMMGRFFAGFTESASQLRQHPKLGPLKEYWMEASSRARNYGRYDTSKDFFFEEGVEGFVQHVGSIYDNLRQTTLKIKSAMSNAGCGSVSEFHKKAVVELQSIASIQDGGIHDIIMN